jgi:hypothetical protein
LPTGSLGGFPSAQPDAAASSSQLSNADADSSSSKPSKTAEEQEKEAMQQLAEYAKMDLKGMTLFLQQSRQQVASKIPAALAIGTA